MRTNLKVTLAAAGVALLSLGGALAAATPSAVIAPVLEACPIEGTAGCATAVAAFIAERPADAPLNDELVDLVAALAYAADHPNVTPAMCIELEQGIRAAGAAVTLPAPKQAIKTIADNLCDDIELNFANASSGGGSGGASSGGGSSTSSSSSTSSTSSSGGSSTGGSSTGGSTGGGSSTGGGGDLPTD